MKEMPSEYRGSYLEKMFEMSKFAAMEEMSQREYLARFMWEVDQRSQLRTARRMLAKGIDIDTIAELTTLSPDEIRIL